MRSLESMRMPLAQRHPTCAEGESESHSFARRVATEIPNYVQIRETRMFVANAQT